MLTSSVGFKMFIWSCLLGVGASLFMDAFSLIFHYWLDFKLRDYSLVGRWVGHMLQGQFVHESIRQSSVIPGEESIGWMLHFLVGGLFAYAFLKIKGVSWLYAPTVWPAIFFGVATIVFPFFIMQPSLGAGVAASGTPHPDWARLNSFIGHLLFGFGLYFMALLRLYLLRLR